MSNASIGSWGCIAAITLLATAALGADLITYTGMCEPSAAVFLPESGFGDVFVVANDEDNTLRAYRTAEGGAPVKEVDLDSVLQPTPEREADLEAATWLGDRVYWIGPHSRNNDGELREDRWQFFSTSVAAGDGSSVIALAPPTSLHSLANSMASLDPLLRDSLQLEVDEDGGLAPDSGGLNIEGMTVRGDGTGVLIGLRSPLSEGGDALVIRFINPAQALRGASIELGPIIPLDLEGRGIRSMEYSPSLGAYLIVAGPVVGNEPFEIFRWNGEVDQNPSRVDGSAAAFAALENFTPEAMIVDPEGGKVLVLSDDGDICTSPPRFRGAYVDVE